MIINIQVIMLKLIILNNLFLHQKQQHKFHKYKMKFDKTKATDNDYLKW